MPTVILVTPNAIERAALRAQLESACPQFAVIGEAASSAQGLKLARRLNPDLVFLEAELPGERPFQLLEAYQADGGPPFAFIALAAHEGWAYQAYQRGALAYLLYSVGADALRKAARQAEARLLVNRLRQAVNDWLPRIYGLAGQKEVYLITLKDLVYIEAKGNCTAVYAMGQSNGICIAKGFSIFLELFGEAPFLFQTSRSNLVNLYYAKRFLRHDGLILMPSNKGGEDIRIPVTRERRKELARRLELLGGWV
jgi:two-component system, LytTR family, response regulator